MFEAGGEERERGKGQTGRVPSSLSAAQAGMTSREGGGPGSASTFVLWEVLAVSSCAQETLWAAEWGGQGLVRSPAWLHC